jgi:hypothetical protein
VLWKKKLVVRITEDVKRSNLASLCLTQHHQIFRFMNAYSLFLVYKLWGEPDANRLFARKSICSV